ncbi:MAG: hypothetical protein ACLRSW_08225 [Christensenellaceae bacterium]
MPGLYSARRHREELSSPRIRDAAEESAANGAEENRLGGDFPAPCAEAVHFDAIIAAGEKREEMHGGRFSASRASPYRCQCSDYSRMRAAYPDEETSVLLTLKSGEIAFSGRNGRSGTDLKNRPLRKARRPYIRNSLFLPQNPRTRWTERCWKRSAFRTTDKKDKI